MRTGAVADVEERKPKHSKTRNCESSNDTDFLVFTIDYSLNNVCSSKPHLFQSYVPGQLVSHSLTIMLSIDSKLFSRLTSFGGLHNPMVMAMVLINVAAVDLVV
jgi:hypothetical protein